MRRAASFPKLFEVISELTPRPKRSSQVEAQWREGHAQLVAALNPPSNTPAGKKFNALLQSRAKGRKVQPLTAEEEEKWFSYEAFLDLLGLVNINLEDSGGLYALHCHMNHSCEPNVQVRLRSRLNRDLSKW